MIGIFDSGIGGLTVVHEIKKAIPGEPLLYLGDTARLPFGTKSSEAVRRFALEISDFLQKRGAGVIVIACNTASAIAARDIERNFPLPVFNVIDPAVSRAREITRNRRVGVIGTPVTVKSGVYQKRLTGLSVFAQACPLLVPLVEEGWLERRETRMIVEHYLVPLKKKRIDTLILGCTHYPLLMPFIRDIMGPDVELVNSAREIALALKKEKKLFSGGSRQARDTFFVTDNPYHFETFSTLILGKKIKAKNITLPSL